jgi:hypothetical protein
MGMEKNEAKEDGIAGPKMVAIAKFSSSIAPEVSYWSNPSGVGHSCVTKR